MYMDNSAGLAFENLDGKVVPAPHPKRAADHRDRAAAA